MRKRKGRGGDQRKECKEEERGREEEVITERGVRRKVGHIEEEEGKRR